MTAMPSEYHIRQRNLALALVKGGVISAKIGLAVPLLSFNLEIPPLTENLAVSIARCIQLLVLQENMEFEAVACIPPSKPFAEVLARLLGKNDKKCIYLQESGPADKQRISVLNGGIPEHIRKILLVSAFTGIAHSEREAIEFLESIGVNVSDAITLVDFDSGTRKELEELHCALHPIFSAVDLREMYRGVDETVE